MTGPMALLWAGLSSEGGLVISARQKEVANINPKGMALLGADTVHPEGAGFATGGGWGESGVAGRLGLGSLANLRATPAQHALLRPRPLSDSP